VRLGNRQPELGVLRLSGVMGAAAYTLPVDREGDWLEELDRILKRIDATSRPVRIAVPSVVESILADLDITDVERAHLSVLLSQNRPLRLRAA
jgi:hypothetical protein